MSLTGGTAAFADKNVGTGKTVTVTGLTLSGTDAGNYTRQHHADAPPPTSRRRDLTVSRRGLNKVYDGTTRPRRQPRRRPRRRRRADVDAYAAATFADKNAGTGKASPSPASPQRRRRRQLHPGQHHGAAAASITPRTLDVAAAARDKVYDGTTAADGQPRR